jgi:poly-gamma-glutamate capsule biosynthesis protein CapA/YwtB (metallophosphatase superfamily)
VTALIVTSPPSRLLGSERDVASAEELQISVDASRAHQLQLRRRLAALTFVAAAIAAVLCFINAGESGTALADPAALRVAKTTSAEASSASSTVRFAATGDIAFGSTPSLPPDGGRSMFTQVAQFLDADVVVGNLETVLADGSGPGTKCAGRTGCFSFRAPPQYARLLSGAGFTVLNLANNHSYDFGPAGLEQTVAALRRARLSSTGRPGEIAVQKVGPVRVAIVGFAPSPGTQDLRDIHAAREVVRRAAMRADLVVVTMHAGAEGSDAAHARPGVETYEGENRGDVVAFSHAVVDAGADLVLGHGPHVLRAMEWYRGRLIAYSLGNFSAYRNFTTFGSGGVSAVLRVTLRSDGRWVRGDLVPIRLVGDGTPVRDPARAAHGVVRRLSREDFGRRAARIEVDGDVSAAG